MSRSRITCTVNGARKVFEAHPMARLLDVIRASGLTGTKEGCGEGECGACGVLLDGMLVNSCLTPAAHELLSRTPEPSEEDIRVALAGNLCRCTGYMRIFEAALEASRRQ